MMEDMGLHPDDGALMPEPKSANKAKEEKEKFFSRLVTIPVSKEEFLTMVKNKYPAKSDEEILQMKGINFDEGEDAVILLRTDIFPAGYMPYLETHEKWESFVARKPGYNLFKKSVRAYKEDRGIEQFDEESKKDFYGELFEYNYEFRHEYAVYKEYERAMDDGKLEEYHRWIMGLREEERKSADERTLAMIDNDTAIRESIYRKLMSGDKHFFMGRSEKNQ